MWVGRVENCPPKVVADQVILSQPEGVRLCHPHYYLVTQLYVASYVPEVYHVKMKYLFVSLTTFN